MCFMKRENDNTNYWGSLSPVTRIVILMISLAFGVGAIVNYLTSSLEKNETYTIAASGIVILIFVGFLILQLEKKVHMRILSFILGAGVYFLYPDTLVSQRYSNRFNWLSPSMVSVS